MVLETNMNEIVTRFDEQSKLEKQEAGIIAAPTKAMTALKEMNIPQKIKDMKLSDLNLTFLRSLCCFVNLVIFSAI